MPPIAKQQGTAAILEELCNLIRVKRRVQRNGRTTSRDNAKVRGDPTRMVVGQDRNSRARLKPVLCQPAADALRHAPRLGVSVALHPVAPLNFQGDIVRPALSAFAKEFVEGWHGPAGKYT